MSKMVQPDLLPSVKHRLHLSHRLHFHHRHGLKYLYQPLDASRAEIRLLRVRPCKKEAERVALKFQMVTVSLQNPPDYWALSYVHGDEKSTEVANINGCDVRMHSSLAQALRYIVSAKRQLGTDEFYLWADSVCINMADAAERNNQVRLMRAVYQSAFCVLAWMGPGTERERDALTTVSDLAHHVLGEYKKGGSASFENGSFIEDFHATDNADVWSAIEDLDSNPVWHRLWMIQELAAAKWILFLCGHSFTRCLDIEIVLSWKSRLQNTPHPPRPSAMDEKVWAHVTSPATWSWFQIGFMMRIRDSVKDGRLSVLEAPWISRYFGAADPKDRVYGVLGLMDGLEVNIDYTKPTHQVYAEFLSKWVKTTGSLEHLFYCGVGHFDRSKESAEMAALDDSIPSWVPNMHHIAMDEGRREAFNPVARRQDDHRIILGPQFDLAARVNTEGPIMDFAGGVFRPTGFVLDQVSRVERMQTIKDLLLFSWGFCGCEDSKESHLCYPTGIAKSHAAVRLMLVNLGKPPRRMRDPFKAFHSVSSGSNSDAGSSTASFASSHNGAEDARWLGHVFGALRDHLTIQMDVASWDSKDSVLLSREERVHVDKLLSDVIEDCCDENFRAGYEEYQEAPWDNLKTNEIHTVANQLRRLLHHRSLFVTSTGYLGLGPPGMRPTDEVVIIPGFRYPVLLRRGESENKYQLVGVCYVAGIMNGVECAKVDEGEGRLEVFEIY